MRSSFLPCTGPRPLLDSFHQARSHRIPFDVVRDPVKLPVTAHPVVKVFVLPEWQPAAPENAVCLPGTVALHSSRDLPQRFMRSQKDVHVVRHHHPGEKFAQPPVVGGKEQSVHDGASDTRMPEPCGTHSGIVHLPVEGHETPTGQVGDLPQRRRGGALLLVLWLTAALGTIAFALAATVRSETERAGAALDQARAYFLATGAIERALLHMEWGSPYWAPWMSVLRLTFPSGEAVVEIVPESAKLNINQAPPEDLHRLLIALGADPARAAGIVEAILDWRTPAPEGLPTPFDRYYLSLTPSFQARHASFEQIEELLLVRGMTPELFHGAMVRDPQARLVPRGGLKHCVSVYGTTSQVDVNTAPPAVLAALGLSPAGVESVLAARTAQPIRAHEQLAALGLGREPGFGRLGIGGRSVFTLRATARLRLPDAELGEVRRSVAATVRLTGRGVGRPYEVLRWHEGAWMEGRSWM